MDMKGFEEDSVVEFDTYNIFDEDYNDDLDEIG